MYRHGRSAALAAIVGAALALPAQASASYADSVVADGPLTYLRLGEAPGATVAQDASPNDRDGAYVGAPALGVAGPFADAGTAAGLAASDAITATVGAASGSVELWVNPNRLAKGQQAGIVAHGDPAGDGWALGIGAKRKLAWIGAGSTVTSRITLPASVWTLLTVTWTTHKVQIYRNGALAKSINRSGPAPVSSSGALAIGGDGAGAFTGPFAGKLDEVALFSQVLTADEVYDHFVAAHVPVNTAPPSIAGTPAVGQTLTAQPGTWTDGGVATYRWQLCDANGEDCDDIVGATDTSYVVAAGDACGTFQVVETMANASGAASAISELTNQVPGSCGGDPGTGGDPGAGGDPGTGTGGGTGAGSEPGAGDPASTTAPGSATGGTDVSTGPGVPSAGCLKLAAGRRTLKLRGMGKVRLKGRAGTCLTARVAVSFKALKGVKLRSVRYTLDNRRLKSATLAARLKPSALGAGTHTLVVRATSRAGAQRRGTLRLRVVVG
jgi:Concanavalin A-like lectin/glucanases superfamily